MSIKPDHWIRRMCREHGMIEPFEEKQVREGVVSYGVSSYGYDIRVADEFKIFTNVMSTVVDPKNVDPASMVDFRGAVCLVPPNSFALARTSWAAPDRRRPGSPPSRPGPRSWDRPRWTSRW